jgi:pimeloyl-ACP methyl ester carboxylesterase
MTTFALLHGAWGTGWHWGSVPEELRRLGHAAVAPDLPCEDPAATFDDYADVVVDALEGAEDVVVVGFSLGGLTAPLVAARRPVRELVYVAAMLPVPGVSLHEQFHAGGRLLHPDYLAGIEGPDQQGATRWVDFDVYRRVGYHDCPEAVARARFARSRRQCTGAYRHACSLPAMPSVPSRYIVCTEDRLLDNGFWRPAARERLGVEPLEIGTGHSPMTARPAEVAGLLAGPAS